MDLEKLIARLQQAAKGDRGFYLSNKEVEFLLEVLEGSRKRETKSE